ncbi:MAG: type I-B CRISPR-associated protein Cas5b [Sulfurihydrogenibium sp.]|jgi:CRISPR-associated protein Cas5t|nr:type I-B CRISPR-associated protein Cas5b [Sulfurihydrogenibium sp.]
MRVLRLQLYQEFACYRKPLTFNFWETYPLPPLSTVKGLFHSVLRAKEYIPAKYSIQGSFESLFLDMQTMNKFTRKGASADGIYIEEYGKDFTKSIAYVANLYAVNLTIYIASDMRYLEKFRENLLIYEYLSLGRKEDLVRVDSVDFVELAERNLFEDEYLLKNGIYFSKEKARELKVSGINYRMRFYYEIEDGIRYFDRKDVVYVSSGVLKQGSILYDKEGDKVVDLIGD